MSWKYTQWTEIVVSRTEAVGRWSSSLLPLSVFDVLLQNGAEESDGAQPETVQTSSRRLVLVKYSPDLFVSVVQCR